MKIGFIFECGPEGPDVQVCRYFVRRLDPNIGFVPVTLDNKPNLVEQCGEVAKILLQECRKVIVIWDLYPPWRDVKPCRYEDRQNILSSLQCQNIDLNRVTLVCIREELEAWLMADIRAVTAVIAKLKHPHQVGRISQPRNPDNIPKPKTKLIKIFNQELRSRYVDTQHALWIARAIPDYTRIRRSESFNRFALKVSGKVL